MVTQVRDGNHAAVSFGHPGDVQVQLSDETFIALDRPSVAAVVGDPPRWADWWPDLTLEVLRDRGDKGRQWVLTGRVTGTAEIYLEQWHDGTVVHLFLRLELPTDGRSGTGASAAEPDKELHRRALAWKKTIHRLKDELEAGRAAGTSGLSGIGPGGAQVGRGS